MRRARSCFCRPRRPSGGGDIKDESIHYSVWQRAGRVSMKMNQFMFALGFGALPAASNHG
jgi:hypothetical protein